MITFNARILKFDKKGEKTGWSYIEVTKRQAQKLSDSRVSFRVKGVLDHYAIQKTALLPMGEGDFILPLSGPIRKALGKGEGDTIKVQLEIDERAIILSADFIKCLKDDPTAFSFFNTLPKSHQIYFSKWIDSAKTITTKTKRITMAIIALSSSQSFAEMLRANRGD